MAPIAGKPFLQLLLENLQRHNFSRIVLSIGYMGDIIQDYFGDRFQDLQLVYAVEEEPLGTGGGIALALSHTQTTHSFVLNGDTFVDLNYQHMHDYCFALSEPRSSIFMALCEMDDATRFGTVSTEKSLIHSFNASGKPGRGTVNAGVYLVKSDLFSSYDLPRKFSFEYDFLEAQLESLRPQAYIIDKPFIDIGVPEDYEKAKKIFSSP